MSYNFSNGYIEYVGRFGVTQSCINGAMRYLQEFSDPIKEAKVITHDKRHAFILFTEERRNTIVVRARPEGVERKI